MTFLYYSLVLYSKTKIKSVIYLLFSYQFESDSCRGVLDTTLCDKVCQGLAAGRWFSLGILVSSTNTTVSHNKHHSPNTKCEEQQSLKQYTIYQITFHS